jgi:hypothetical protein
MMRGGVIQRGRHSGPCVVTFCVPGPAFAQIGRRRAEKERQSDARQESMTRELKDRRLRFNNGIYVLEATEAW